MKYLIRILLIAAIALAGFSVTQLAVTETVSAAQAQNNKNSKEADAVSALTKLGVPMHRDPTGVVRWIEAANGELSDAAMAYLPALPALEWLEIGGGKVTAVGAAHLKDCTALKRLYIYDINLAGDELKWLAALTKLEALSLRRAGITADALKNIAAPNLVVLNLSGNPVRNEALDYAARIKGLEVLSLADTQITGAGLEKLRGMTRLNELNLMRCNIYDQDINVFLSMPNLRIVYAEGSALTDYGIQGIIMRFQTLAIFR